MLEQPNLKPNSIVVLASSPENPAPEIPHDPKCIFGNDTPYSTKSAVVKKKPKLNRFTSQGAPAGRAARAPFFGIDLFGHFSSEIISYLERRPPCLRRGAHGVVCPASPAPQPRPPRESEMRRFRCSKQIN
jgi:hypothetical protein